MEEKQPNRLLRWERELRGWSQKALAAQLGTTEQSVNHWESGLHKPNKYFQAQLCQLYAKSAEELGFMDRGQKTEERDETRTDIASEMGSEQTLSNLLQQRSEVSSIFHIPQWERLSRVLEKFSPIDESGINSLEQIAKEYWKLRATIGYCSLLHALSGLLETVIECLECPQSPATRKRLYIIASKVAQNIGAIYFDMNNYLAAQKYYDVSITTAQEAEDYALWAIGLVRMSSLPIYSKKPQEALPLLLSARRLAETYEMPAIFTWISAMEAEAYADLHDETCCFQSLRRAEQIVEQTGTKEDSHEIKFDYARFIGYKGLCYLRLQKPEVALSALNESAQLNTLSVRQRSIILTDSAAAYTQQGEIEEACSLSIQALSMTDHTKSSLVRQRLLNVRRDMVRWENSQLIKEFDSQLALRGISLS